MFFIQTVKIIILSTYKHEIYFEKQAYIVQKFHETQRVIKVQRAWCT
jgi:hypothetical protein